MSYVNWKIKGPKVATCNCDFGCPCEFLAPPTNANLCEGVEIMRIDEGWFGDGTDQVRLDGLLVGARYRWPGPLHKGGGIVQGLFEERTSGAQREALFKILGGEEQEPTTVFNIYGSTVETEYDPLFGNMDFAVEFKARTARFAMAGVTEMTVEPDQEPGHWSRLFLAESCCIRASSTAPPRWRVPPLPRLTTGCRWTTARSTRRSSTVPTVHTASYRTRRRQASRPHWPRSRRGWVQ